MSRFAFVFAFTSYFGAIAGCDGGTREGLGSDGAPPIADAASTSDAGGTPTLDMSGDLGSQSDPQLPPTGAAALKPWLDAGYYKSWHCEAQPHPRRGVGAHESNRICSNDVLSAAGAGEYPVGAAAVKELWDSGLTRVTGYSVYRKLEPGDCNSFYYYEGSGGPSAYDGKGEPVCVGCHQAASPSSNPVGHDCVYTQVTP
jgi:hypothetical protein